MSAPLTDTLVVYGLRKRLGGRVILDELELRCPAGSITVIRGPNGAGKSTLLRIIAGVLAPDRGTMDLDGASLARRRTRRALGYVPEAADPPGHLTGEELLALVASLKGVPALPAPLRAELGLDTIGHFRIERMSLGERRRTCLAAALIGEPALLVLDEPTNGLDAAGVQMLASLLVSRASDGAAILVATHDQDFARRLDARVFELKNGRLQVEAAA